MRCDIDHVDGISAERLHEVDELSLWVCSSRGRNGFGLI